MSFGLKATVDGCLGGVCVLSTTVCSVLLKERHTYHKERV